MCGERTNLKRVLQSWASLTPCVAPSLSLSVVHGPWLQLPVKVLAHSLTPTEHVQ